MVSKDVKSYLMDNYADCHDKVSDLSKSGDDKVLVEDERRLFNFDRITKTIYQKKYPESADAIYATDKKIFFVEYKCGFKKKINQENFDKSLMMCPDDNEKYCKEYANLFIKMKKKESEILRHSIHMKAIESYMTFFKEIEPNSQEDNKAKSLIYCVVVDDYVESMEDILTDLAEKTSQNNTITSLRQSLSRFVKNGRKDYYYDEINVFSPYEFKRFLDKNYGEV